MSKIKFIIITGMSGAGKSLALRSFEDMRYFCVDNLPTMLIPKMAEVCFQSKGGIRKVALGIDIREGEFLNEIFTSLDELKKLGIDSKILFLEADDRTLIKRYSETRRKHPFETKGATISEVVAQERRRLAEIKENSDRIMDTSRLSPQEFREGIFGVFKESEDVMSFTLISFGYKYGIPPESDLIIDTRFLPNPNYVPELKPLSGNNPPVSKYVLKSDITQKFLRKYFGFLNFLIPYYIKEGKSYLTIGVGCTGGRHRSVVVVNELKARLEGKKNYVLKIHHRDIDRNK